MLLEVSGRVLKGTVTMGREVWKKEDKYAGSEDSVLSPLPTLAADLQDSQPSMSIPFGATEAG